MLALFWHVYVLWLGYPLQWPRYTTFRLNFFYIMTSQRDNTMRIRRRATLEYVKRIDATRYIAPCMCHTIWHIHGNDVLPLREVWYVIFLPNGFYHSNNNRSHVKCWYFCPILTKFQFSRQNCNKISQYNESQKSIHWEVSFTRKCKLTGRHDEVNL